MTNDFDVKDFVTGLAKAHIQVEEHNAREFLLQLCKSKDFIRIVRAGQHFGTLDYKPYREMEELKSENSKLVGLLQDWEHLFNGDFTAERKEKLLSDTYEAIGKGGSNEEKNSSKIPH